MWWKYIRTAGYFLCAYGMERGAEMMWPATPAYQWWTLSVLILVVILFVEYSRWLIRRFGDDRIFVQRTIQELSELCNGKTSAAAQHAIKPYIGFWLKIDGPVRNVAEIYGRWHVALNTEPMVHLFFARRWGKRMSVLQAGDLLVAIGKIDGATHDSISLKSCELVEG